MTRPPPARLPASARARLDRFAGATTHPSFLSVPAAFGVRAAGFEAVGDVMGCIAFQTSIEYLGSCGITRATRYQPRVVVTPSSGSTYGSYLRQLAGAYRTALERLRAEASVLGADGVLGVDLQLAQHENVREVVAVGTAVRSTGRVRPKRLFTSDLSGADVSKLMLAGWAPVELHVAVQAALRHSGQLVPGANAAWTRINIEVPGLTEVRQRAAQAVRDKLRAQVKQAGADGALLSDLKVDLWERRCLNVEGEDLVGLATATGTSIARFAGPSAPAPRPLVVLPIGKEKP